MILETKKIPVEHTRVSKLGIKHAYSRLRTVVVIRCDNCGVRFERALGKMDHRRLSNSFFHVCPHCDPKRFAQRKGAERRTLWNSTVDRDIDISRL